MASKARELADNYSNSVVDNRFLKRNVDESRGFKNYIINGGFDIWQRGGSQSTLGYGSADRWFFGVTNALVGNLNRAEIAKINNRVWGGATFRAHINVTTAPNKITSLLEQRIENPFRLSGKTVTVSFYSARPSGVGSIFVNFFSNVVKINSNDVNINIGTFTPGPGIVRYSFTYTLPTFDEKTIRPGDFLALRFVVPSGFLCSGLGISGVQLEEGSVATPFEQRPVGLELALCERYYKLITMPLISSPEATVRVANNSTVSMRSIPTLSITNIVSGTGGTFNLGTFFVGNEAASVNVWQNAQHSVNTHATVVLDAEL